MRVDPAVKDEWSKAASEAGMSLSQYIEKAVEGQIVLDWMAKNWEDD